MIEVESQITSTLLELSSYASNGDMGLPSDDNYPEKDILVNQSNCQAPHIEDFIVAHYLTEQREVRFRFFNQGSMEISSLQSYTRCNITFKDLYQLKALKAKYETFTGDEIRFDSEILSQYL